MCKATAGARTRETNNGEYNGHLPFASTSMCKATAGARTRETKMHLHTLINIIIFRMHFLLYYGDNFIQ
jgi:hypothetical protein